MPPNPPRLPHHRNRNPWLALEEMRADRRLREHLLKLRLQEKEKAANLWKVANRRERPSLLKGANRLLQSLKMLLLRLRLKRPIRKP